MQFSISYSWMKSVSSLITFNLEILSWIDVDIEGNNLILSAKYSLINSVQQLPSELSQVHPNSVVHVSTRSFRCVWNVILLWEHFVQVMYGCLLVEMIA